MPSKTARMVMTLGVFAAIGVIMLTPVVTAVNANTGTVSVTDETVTAQTDERVDLRGYDIDPASVTVEAYNDSSGSWEMTTEYTLYDQPGEIQFDVQNSTLIDDGEEVRVTYDYQATGELTALVAGFIPVGVGLFIFVGIARRVETMM
ncbi:hypothetical protein EI982_14590 [Haloplanus rallus]|uniref:Uncharacterized protein n=1 Tax=Haloplanus rallus TaxID=1816183 RepID=A0A6B9F5X1_9EURY|nr:hypothetical protein [Haloplanus rallus]QGX95925.1 hypothetical protein EI982_14590 [Haloplanus rallus]